MTREIKFRAWFHLLDKMEYNIAIEVTGNNGLDDVFVEFAKHPTQITVMQYTGLKDKNGKEIYEGDVMNSPVQQEQVGDSTTATFFPPNVVGFKDGAFVLFLGGNPDLIISLIENQETSRRITEETEVIGNIYENPELLK